MKKISILGLLVLFILVASCSLAFGSVTLKDKNTGNTVDLYPTVDEKDKGLLFYGNNRFGYSVKVPEAFTKVILLPDNEDGMVLETEDGKAAFRVSGGFVMNEGMLKESFDSALESIGGKDNATYFDVGEDSWELYWWKGETFHSRKFVINGEETWSDCEISYQSSPDEGMYGPGDEIVHLSIQSLVFGKG